MAHACKYCGGETNHITKTCAPCRIDPDMMMKNRIDPDMMMKKKKEEVMPVTEKNKGRKCSVEGCFKFAVRGGMCTKHYNEAHGIKKRRGRKPSGKKYKYTCEVEGCKKGRWKDKRCLVHWKEKHGTQDSKSVIARSEVTKQSNEKVRHPATKKAIDAMFAIPKERKCRICGCTDDDCSQCIEKTGLPCHWVEVDLCSACSKIQEPEQYIISVDFSFYPKLHEKLLKLADEDFRNPGQQLLSMLHHTLKEAEART